MIIKSHQEVYSSNGIVKIALPDTCIKLKQEFSQQLSEWIKHWCPGLRSSENSISKLLTEAASIDRPLVSKLYKVCRRFPALKQLASHQSLVDLSADLMNTNQVSCCHFVAVRFDLPGESSFLIKTHQDFPYIQGSENGVTVWTALSDVDERLGPPEYVPGSHSQGVIPIHEKPLNETYGKHGASTNEIRQDVFDDREYIYESVLFGEALAFSTLLVHRSKLNITDECRISIQLRFDDLLSENSYAKNYPEGLYLKNAFSDNFPEYIKRDAIDEE